MSKELRDASPGSNRTASLEKLYEARTYFKNNWKKMIYPEALDKHLPLGSGVTEAACKILVKQRMCRSGMRWKEKGASMLNPQSVGLFIRSLGVFLEENESIRLSYYS